MAHMQQIFIISISILYNIDSYFNSRFSFAKSIKMNYFKNKLKLNHALFFLPVTALNKALLQEIVN